MENLPVVKQESGVIDYDNPKMVATLKATVAQNATDEEFAMFAGLCRSTGLNPFKKEVWFIKTKPYRKKDGTMSDPKVQIMTGINGFLAIANNHSQFDGIECDVEYGKDGLPVKATAKVWRKDRKFPSKAEALWSEYYKPNPHGNKGVWEQMPSVMIAKCAKSLALREAFPQELNGLYTQEEMPADYAQPEAQVIKPNGPVNEQTQPQAAAPQPAPKAAPAQAARTYAYKFAPVKEMYQGMGAKDGKAAWIRAIKLHQVRIDEAAGLLYAAEPVKDWALFEHKNEAVVDDTPDFDYIDEAGNRVEA